MVLTRLLLTLLALLITGLPVQAGDPAPLVIFAASSLRLPFQELASRYQEKYQTAPPLLHFSGSQVLRAQLEQGAAADILVSANTEIMAALETQGLIDHPRNFAGNRLALLVDRRCFKVRRLEDLAAPGLLLAIGNSQVPIGRYTRQFWQNLSADPEFGPRLLADIQRNIVSEESSVKALVTKLQLGEIDAALVYRSELTENLLVRTRSIELPERHNPIAGYPIAVTRRSTARVDAERFIALLFSAEGQQLLGKYHFQPAPEPSYANR